MNILATQEIIVYRTPIEKDQYEFMQMVFQFMYDHPWSITVLLLPLLIFFIKAK